MEQNPPVPPAPASNAANVQPPAPQMPEARKKTSSTGIVLVILFLIATIITAAVYFLLPQKQQEQPAKSNTGTPVHKEDPQTKDHTPWTTYTDKQYDYHFYYPQTWKLEKDKTNPNKFVLSESGSTPGEIQGEFMSKEQFSKEPASPCTPATTTAQTPCLIFEKTRSSSAYVHPTVDTNNKITFATAYITRPDGTGFLFKITQPNVNSYDVFLSMIDTLQFPNEKRIVPLLICPDSTSADKKTVTYRGVTFSATDVDQSYIQKNCK